MNPDFWKTAGAVLGMLVAAPIILLTFRAGSFFGDFKKTVKSMEHFVTEATKKIDDHGSRIQRIEDERRMEREFAFGRRHQSRRAGDPPPADEPENRD